VWRSSRGHVGGVGGEWMDVGTKYKDECGEEGRLRGRAR